MKNIKILLLILSLSVACFSDMEYIPDENTNWKMVSNFLTLPKNIIKIELVKMVMERVVPGVGGERWDAPESLQVKLVLDKKMFKYIINDINKMTLIRTKQDLSGMCCELRIYERENIIIYFKTNGYFLYDETHNLLYEYPYSEDLESDNNLIYKYWGIEGYGKYIWVK